MDAVGVNVHSAEALASVVFKKTAFVFELLRLLAHVVDGPAVVHVGRATI